MQLFDVILPICTAMFKFNVKNTEEVATIIEELGLVEKGAEMGKVITNAFITPVA